MICRYHKGLSKDTIRKLADFFKILQKAFNRPYRIINNVNCHFRDASLMNTKKDIVQVAIACSKENIMGNIEHYCSLMKIPLVIFYR